MNHWFFYIFERFHPFFSFIVITGIAISTAVFDHHSFDPAAFMASSMVWFFFALFFRLNNDLKDADVDKIAYPDRPIPSGAIQRKEAETVLKGLRVILVVLGIAIFFYFGVWSRLLFLSIAGYCWLIYHKFYLGSLLDRRPLLKTVMFQGIVFLMTLLSISFSHSEVLFTEKSLSYCLLLFSAFFTFELCRKLNPFAHPASQSLIHFFGFKKVFIFASVSLLVSAIGAYGFGVAGYLIPVQIGMFLSLILIFKHPRRYAIVQMAANFSLVVHSWSALFERV